MTLLDKIASSPLPELYKTNFHDCYLSYREAVGEIADEVFSTYLRIIIVNFESPPKFDSYHQKVRKPFDYAQFGEQFISPLIRYDQSTLEGTDVIEEIQERQKAGENAILLANHQTEPDPQILQLLLKNRGFELSEHLTFVAGDRVLTDLIAVPASMGCDLFAIHSKKHIDNPPEKKAEKIAQNRRTLSVMQEMLSEGGMCIYIAPSGGRDRKNSEGVIEVSPFDPQSIEMLYLLSQKAKKPTRFYPLALRTYDLFPPPEKVEKELGEKRTAARVPVSISFGPAFSMESFPGSDASDKRTFRENRATSIHSQVLSLYNF